MNAQSKPVLCDTVIIDFTEAYTAYHKQIYAMNIVDDNLEEMVSHAMKILRMDVTADKILIAANKLYPVNGSSDEESPEDFDLFCQASALTDITEFLKEQIDVHSLRMENGLFPYEGFTLNKDLTTLVLHMKGIDAE